MELEFLVDVFFRHIDLAVVCALRALAELGKAAATSERSVQLLQAVGAEAVSAWQSDGLYHKIVAEHAVCA